MTDAGGLDSKVSVLMSEYRRKKLDKIKSEQAKRLSLGAELMLCYALKKHYPEIALPPEIKLSQGGKPYMDGVFFSLSHSKKYAACAVSDSEVGLDIEKINPRQNLAVGKKFLTDDEFKALTAENFFDFWTKKESYIKLRGFDKTPTALKFSVLDGNFCTFEKCGYKITAASEKPDAAEISVISAEEAIAFLKF